MDLENRLAALRSDGWGFAIYGDKVNVSPPKYVKDRCGYVDDISFNASITVEGAVSWCEGFLVALLSMRIADRMREPQPEPDVNLEDIDALLDSIDFDEENPLFKEYDKATRIKPKSY